MKLDVKLEILPYQEVAGIRFGMTPAQVREILGNPVSRFKKTSTSELETDAFDHLGIQVFYKQPGVCEAIELSAPAEPALQGKSLVGESFQTLKEWFQAIDDSVEIDETGLTSHLFGIGLYAPFAATLSDKPVESVLVFEQRYYSSVE
jgi:hypothetical protein